MGHGGWGSSSLGSSEQSWPQVPRNPCLNVQASQEPVFLQLCSHGTFHLQNAYPVLAGGGEDQTGAHSTLVLFLCSPNMAALYLPSAGQADKTSTSPKSPPVTGFLSNLRGAATFSANHCSFLIPVPQARAKGGRFLRRQAMAFFLWPQAQSSTGTEFGFFVSHFFIFIPKFQQHQLPLIQC